MKKKIWDLYAPIYEKAMRADKKEYAFMYQRILEVIKDKEVLEIATGPGLLAKHVAHSAKRMVATDYSSGMIKEAKKGSYPPNLQFDVADATKLPYSDNLFDVVIIANALHVMPEPDKALKEIDRVLRDNGLLIAPNLVKHSSGTISRIWSGILKIAGISSEYQWSVKSYVDYLESQGWKVIREKEMKSRITVLYTECVRK
jgi:ubiquinone/menaquinone biosynthesis C-methylase UbiE